jgi:hypothetical protein
MTNMWNMNTAPRTKEKQYTQQYKGIEEQQEEESTRNVQQIRKI